MERKPIGVIITDTHLSEKTADINRSVWAQADAAAMRLGVDLYHAGDIFNSRKSQTLDVLSMFSDILDGLNSKLNMIPGNHDKVDYRAVESYLDPYKNHPNVFLIRMSGGIPVGDVMIHMLPYFLEEDVYLEYLKKMVDHSSGTSWGKKNVLITHVSVTGVKNNDASVVVNNIKQELFSAFDLVLIGHYHDTSEIGSNIRYIGSTYQGNFGEDVEKGYTILYDDLSLEHVPMIFPKYVVEEIDLEELSLNQIDMIHEHHAGSEDFVRFKFKGTDQKLKALDRGKYVKDGIDVVVVQESIEEAIEAASGGELVKYNKSNIREEFVVFCKENGLDEVVGMEYLNKQLG